MPNPKGQDQRIVRPRVASIEGRQNLTRRQAAACVAGQAVEAVLVLRDPGGDPVDFSDIAEARVRASVREALSASPGGRIVTASIRNAEQGEVAVPLSSDLTAFPGVSLMDVGVFDAADKLVFANEFYLLVNASQWGEGGPAAGPPTLQELRLRLRDSGPEDNLWLDVEEFDLAEICACLIDPVAFWNESPPPISLRYNTSNFPYRKHWMTGSAACLYYLAAHHYRRTHLPYQAGGVAVDDKNRGPVYQEMGDRLWMEYRSWLRGEKIRLNAQAAYGSVLSGYSQL